MSDTVTSVDKHDTRNVEDQGNIGKLQRHAVGRLVTAGRRKIVRLTSTHAMGDRIRRAPNRIGRFLSRLARTAEQLSVERIWAIILSAAFVKWLRGKALDPVADGNRMLTG